MSRPDFNWLDRPLWINSHSLPCRYFFLCNIRSADSLKNGCSGWITHSYSWRVVHVVLGLLGLFIFTTIYFFFPETIEPGATGVDKAKAANGIDSSTPFIFKFINPFKSLWLLRCPCLLLTVRLTLQVSTSHWYPQKGIIMSASQLSFFGEVLHRTWNTPLFTYSDCQCCRFHCHTQW